MANLSTVEARSQFADLINRVAYGKERVILTRRGKALVAVVPIEQMQILEAAIRALELFPCLEHEQVSSSEEAVNSPEVARVQEHV